MNTNGSVSAADLSLNYEYQLMVRTGFSGGPGGGATENYAPVAVGFDNITESLNEVLYQSGFISDKGWGSSYVTGGQMIVTLTGVRVKGDKAQDYIFSDEVMYGFGKARETAFRMILPEGDMVECSATLAKITRSGGAANQPTAISVEIHFNGEPTYTAKEDITE